MDKACNNEGREATILKNKLKSAITDAIILVYAKGYKVEIALEKIAKKYGETIARKVKHEIF